MQKINAVQGIVGIIFMLVFLRTNIYAQKDTVCFKNADCIVGEVKSLEKGVITFETDYSDSDFKIEWNKVRRISTRTRFMVTLKDGTKYYSTLGYFNDSTALAKNDTGVTVFCPLDEIVFLSAYKEKFSERFSSTIDIGFDLARAKNLRSLNIRATVGYKADKWETDMSYNTLNSTQDSTNPIKRNDGEFNFRYALPKKFYSIATVALLSNTEQKLDLRLNTQAGIGFFLIMTNKSYWGIKAGINRNRERYSEGIEERNSWEGFFGTELNLFDTGDLSLKMVFVAYPGIDKSGRWRYDSNFDMKYDLPWDFYIRLGASLNFDNQPVAGASELDYVINTGFGWEW